MENYLFIRRGRNLGAVLGIVMLFLPGIAPGFYLGSYGALLLLSRLTGGPLEPGFLMRTVAAAGGAAGILAVAALSVAAGSITGTVVARAIHILKSKWAEREEVRFGTVGNPGIVHRLLTAEAEAGIRSSIFFPGLRREGIHSISVIGSSAYNSAGDDSDIDVVIICKENGYSPVRDFLCERELEKLQEGETCRRMEYTILNPSEAESLFRMRSPFAWSIRHGAVIADDGYLENLCKKTLPSRPSREYYSKAFRENVVLQYTGSILTLERQTRKNGCSPFCCEERNGCGGLQQASMFAVVTMRMLYITLPSRGYVPLTKADVLEFVNDVYGEERCIALVRVMPLIRGVDSAIYYSDYKALKSFSRELFREVLGIVGTGKDVTAILRDAARMARGDYRNVQDRTFRRCAI